VALIVDFKMNTPVVRAVKRVALEKEVVRMASGVVTAETADEGVVIGLSSDLRSSEDDHQKAAAA
jgi:hypothetical protein